jgi:hypothetical protein
LELPKRATYVIGRGENLHKIGISTRPYVRAEELGGSLLFHVFRPDRAARAIEQVAHRQLVAHVAGGEWFNVDAQTAINTVKEATRLVDGGDPAGFLKTVVMNFRVPDDFAYQMRSQAIEHRMTLSELFIAAVEAYGAAAFK